MSTRPIQTRGSRGFTLIELIVFIVIVGAGLAGVLSVFNVTVMHSADPMLRKQMLALAESLLEEATMMPFTYCDPTDDNASNAGSAALDATHTDATKCWRAVEAQGASNEQWNGTALSNQTRGSTTAPFNNVNDYHGLALNPITDAAGNNSYAGYSATIAVANTSSASDRLGGTTAVPDSEALLVTVTVSHAGADSITLQGYRTRYAPNQLP